VLLSVQIVRVKFVAGCRETNDKTDEVLEATQTQTNETGACLKLCCVDCILEDGLCIYVELGSRFTVRKALN
jgi:hypothetical protein